MYFAICYVSSAHNLNDFKLNELFKITTNLNHKNNISGILLHNTGNFLQYMEGEEAQIKSLYYDKISKDNRHKNPIILFEKKINHLYFEGYDSGFSSILGPSKLRKLISYMELLNQLETKEVDMVTSTIETFLGKSTI